MIRFGLVLWHINHCWLSNAKFDLYILDLLTKANKVEWFLVLLCITATPIKHQSIVYRQLNNETVLFQAIQFSISHLFVLSLNVKQTYLPKI